MEDEITNDSALLQCEIGQRTRFHEILINKRKKSG